MTDFLLELLSEEIPARMQAKARADLERLFAEEIAKSGLKAQSIETHATPRRLILIARGLPAETAAVSEEVKGPRVGAPPQALEGFLRKTGLTADQLVERDGVLFAVIDKPGRATPQVLAEAIPAIVRTFPWPKSMRWGVDSSSSASLRWVRPLQGIVALFGDDVVDFGIDGIRSGAATVGHRFHHPGPITIGSAHDYVEKLRACHVIVSHEERQQIIRDGAAKAAAAAGLSVIPDEGLVQENAGLTEYPVPLLGHFDPAFLEVPREVIQLTMRTNQKYFALTDGEGRLAPNFICTANIEPVDGGTAIAAGNAKVLAARLSDAKFFWEQDLKIPLEEQAKKLDQIVFHEKLGTVADKVDRVAKLARWLVEEGIVPPRAPAQAGAQGLASGTFREAIQLDPGLRRGTEELAHMAEQAARLCKADLVTGMVGEFPELQGVMGGYYARVEALRGIGFPESISDAIRDHYKPIGQGDDVPNEPVTVAVSLADKLDSIIVFFFEGMSPTGSKDPYALRRAAFGVIALISESGLRLSFSNVVGFVLSRYAARKNASNILRKEEALAEAEAAIGGAINSVQRHQRLKEIETRMLSSERMIHDFTEPAQKTLEQVLYFFADRLKVQQREAGVRHDLIDAVFALGGEDDLVRLLARVKALQSFVASDDGANLLTGYKRAANILKKEGFDSPSVRVERSRDAQPSEVEASGDGVLAGARNGFSTSLEANGDFSLSYTPENEEAVLIAALDAAEAQAGAAVDAEDFEGAMAALAGLRAPIDAFFDKVTVNDPDPAKRAARLGLLARIRNAVHKVADFSRIEG